jgi:hypothetical protein
MVKSTRTTAWLTAVLAMVAAALAFATSAQADPTPYPSGTGSPAVSVSSTTPAPGGPFSASGDGATPNGSVSGDLHTAVYHLATVTADATGHWSMSTTLPAGVTGNHTFVVTDVATGKTLASVALDIGGAAAGSSGGGSGGGGGGLAITGVAIIGLGTIGVALLVGGGLMLMAGRRRRVSA